MLLAKALPATNLDQMIAESLRDIPSDESSGGEDDPSLLVSYHHISNIQYAH